MADRRDLPGGSAHGETTSLSRNARFGLMFFAGYLLLYGGFMGVSAFAPDLMSRRPFGGVNLAVLYGLLLIVAALVLALIYAALCNVAGDHPEELK